MQKKIAVSCENLSLGAKAAALAYELQLPFVSPGVCDYPLILLVTEERLEIREIDNKRSRPFFIDFLQGKIGFRTKHASRRNELLAKAIGLKFDKPLNVLDCTAGLGRDAWILAGLGCCVTMLERSKIIAALLNDGLKRAFRGLNNNELVNKIDLRICDAKNYLMDLKHDDSNNEEFRQDVIYLDPMFPLQEKTALAKKEMRLLREIVGQDDDADELLELALNCRPKRLVIKRPVFAHELKNPKPNLILRGCSSRFDVYCPR